MAQRVHPRSSRRSAGVAAAFAACLLSGVGAANAVAATGDLIQKPGAAGCLSVVGFCSPARALVDAESVTVSPDGESAYVVSNNAVAVFDRGGDGTLTQKRGQAGCISDTGGGSCADGIALDGADSVTVSPDGRSAYVASNRIEAVAVFDRASNGRLVQKPGRLACISNNGDGPCVEGTALEGPTQAVVSPDGGSVYVTSSSDDAVAVFDRARDGSLTQKLGPAGCISESGAEPCADGRALIFPTSVAVSPDGQSAYVGSSDAVAVFDRAPDGTLSQKPGTAGCISDDGSGSCRDGTGIDGRNSVTVSPDGRSAYVASLSDALAIFDRRPNGRLVQKPGTAGCVSGTGAGPCVDGTALNGARSVAVSPDGQSAYVASDLSNAIALFDRAPNGSLVQKPGAAGCIRDAGGAGRCAEGEALDGPISVAVSPDGKNAYVASVRSDSVAVFDREASSRSRRGRRP